MSRCAPRAQAPLSPVGGSIANSLDPRLSEMGAAAPPCPLVSDVTRLDLFEGMAGDLRASWHLHAGDGLRLAAAFPSQAGVAAPVLRVFREHTAEHRELLAEIPLLLARPGGQGEQVVAACQPGASFASELGLVSPDGGWLSLARSATFQCAGRWALDLVRLSRVRAEVARRGAALAGPRLTDAAVALDLERTLAIWPGLNPGAAGEAADLRAPGAAGESGDQRRGSAMAEMDTAQAEMAGAARAAATEIPRAAEAALLGVALPVTRYGTPSASATDLLIEAELRISGRAPPNSEIDLFGFRYQVGPGGCFQLVLPVADAELLRRCLEQHPPPELTRRRGS